MNDGNDTNAPEGTGTNSEPVLVPGARDVRGTLDRPGARASGGREAVVVACPPHPQHGGRRSDSRLGALSSALGDRGVGCLRFDYGPWAGGEGERLDTRNALRWASRRYDSVGLFGYSFGATVALCAAGELGDGEDDAPEQPTAVSVLAPDRGTPSADPDGDHAGNAVAALDWIGCPTQICYGERDGTVDWEPVVSRARERGFVVEAIASDHFFVGRMSEVAALIASFLAGKLQ